MPSEGAGDLPDWETWAAECIAAVVAGPVAVVELVDESGYTTDEVYATAKEAAEAGFNAAGGAYASGYDVLYDVEQAIKARTARLALTDALSGRPVAA